MSFRINFSGHIKQSEIKKAGDKTIVELSLCHKNYTKPGAEESYTWLRVTVWEPKSFQLPQFTKGFFVAGSGEFTIRSYVNKDGVKQQSAECRSSSFDIDGPRQDVPAQQEAPPTRVAKPSVPASEVGQEEPPF